jgi:hypothetical protein
MTTQTVPNKNKSEKAAKPAAAPAAHQLSIDLATATPEELQAEIARLSGELTKAQSTRTRTAAVPKTEEEKAAAAKKAEGRVAFETFNYAPETSELGKLQRMGRPMHIYAFYKIIKYFSFDRLSRVLYDLCDEAATQEGLSVEHVIGKVTSRVAKAPKAAEPAATTEA